MSVRICMVIMSTNSFVPFEDVVVNTPGGSLEDCFDSDKKQKKIIYEHRQYHLAMMHFLHNLERNGPGGSDMLKRPKADPPSLLGNKNPSNKLYGVELQKYLIKSLLSKDVVNQPDFAKDGSILIWTKVVRT